MECFDKAFKVSAVKMVTEEGQKEVVQNNDNLLIEIGRVFWDNNRNYGSPRAWDYLRNKEQIPCSVNRVARFMHCNVS